MIETVAITSLYLGSAVVALSAIAGIAYLLSELFGFR